MSVLPPTLLLVDDEEHLRSMLEAALRHHGFDVHLAETGRRALTSCGSLRPDLVLLDVMLPDLDGFEVCRRLRADGVRVPIVFLTARDDTSEKVRGLTIGGDDYMVKPFSIQELVARINAVLRRTGSTGAEPSELRCGDLVLDDDAHRVTVAGEEVSLSVTEFNLLRFLMFNQGRVVSKSQILDDVWSFDFGGSPSIVETYIGYLRRKVDLGQTKLIHTVRGVGYTLRSSPRSS
jgi:two-component system OmpR family response regulator